MSDQKDCKQVLNFAKAAKKAADAHGKQTYPDGRPYITHPIGVAYLVLECGGTLEEGIAALLHDTVEDAGLTLEQICEEFGAKVAEIVGGCTDNPDLDPEGCKRDKLAKARKALKSVKVVRMADMTNNLESLHASPPKKWTKEELFGYACWCRANLEEMLEIYPELVAAMKDILEKFGVLKLTKEELHSEVEKYLKNIKHSK